MELLKYLIALICIHASDSQKFYYKQDGEYYDVYYGPDAIHGYQEMMAPKSFKPFYDRRLGKCIKKYYITPSLPLDEINRSMKKMWIMEYKKLN